MMSTVLCLYICLFAASQTVKELGNLIEGLDNLLRSTSQASAVDKPTDHEEMTGPGDGSGTSLQPPPISKLLSQTGLLRSVNSKTDFVTHCVLLLCRYKVRRAVP